MDGLNTRQDVSSKRVTVRRSAITVAPLSVRKQQATMILTDRGDAVGPSRMRP
jgi:hypothetical protein